MVVRDTHGTPRCDRVWGQRVNVGVDGCDPAGGSPVSQFAVHSGQHGCVRIVAHQCGWKGCRVGEATSPGPSQSDFATQLVGGSDDQEPCVWRVVGRTGLSDSSLTLRKEADQRSRSSLQALSRDKEWGLSDELGATQVDWGGGGRKCHFDMTVADSHDECEVHRGMERSEYLSSTTRRRVRRVQDSDRSRVEQ